ncbi:MAG TPA: potassium transporter TrkG [Tepidisphaeraceae bacterium]|nr:potassium transporter TrkG [Tepidisphaeraceae bacterium]
MPANAPIQSVIPESGRAPGAAARGGAGGWLCLALVFAYLLLMAGVVVVVRSPAVVARGNETTWDRAIFTAINAGTLSGFQQTMGLREMSANGSVGPLLMLGLTFSGTLVSLIVGGLAGVRILQLPHDAGRVVWAAIWWVLLATLAGAAALTVSGRSVFEAIFQAASAFANSGLWLGQTPAADAASSFLVLLPLAVLGGLGLPVLIELHDRIFGGPPLSRHSRVVLKWTGLVYLIGLVVLVLAQTPAAMGGGWTAWKSTIGSCSIAAVNTRTAGMPFQSPAAFTVSAQWLLMVLMVIGAASAGTAGGVKFTSIWQLVRGIVEILRGRTAQRAAGIAAVWMLAYGFVAFVGLLILLACEPQIPADRTLFLTISAMGNVGLWHDPVSITGPGLLVLSALMLAGRLGPLAVLWWMAKTTSSDVLVG